jgi:protein tyrosine phosphatase (PTP) superfamily phosphohydrolase (DUF442 family)
VVDRDDIYNNSLTLGWDYQSNANVVKLIYDVTGVDVPVTAPTIEQTLTNGESSYNYYYWSHRIDDYWYNVGQPLDTQVNAIASAGYKSVISFRNNGESTTHLATDPTGYADNNEFEDANGYYNVTAEKSAFESVGIHFYNLPVTGSNAWTAALLDQYTPTIEEAVSYGPVLVHCTVGYRSAAYITAYLARKNGKCTTWALKQSRRVGFSYDQLSSDAKVVQFFEDSLHC